jgi:hypothetical protein
VKSYDSPTLDLLASGRCAKRDMILLDFAGTLYGFWSGIGTILYQSVTYIGAGRLISIEPIDASIDLSAQPITLKLSSVPDSALTPDVLASIESYPWHQAPVVLSVAYIDPDTRSLVSVHRVSRRRLDTLEHVITAGGEAVLMGRLEPVTFDNAGRGYRMSGDADQRLLDSDDAFFSFAATAGQQTIYWGRAPTPQA